MTWDPAKAQANLRKHGIHFSDAEGVLFDPLGVTIEVATFAHYGHRSRGARSRGGGADYDYPSLDAALR